MHSKLALFAVVFASFPILGCGSGDDDASGAGSGGGGAAGRNGSSGGTGGTAAGKGGSSAGGSSGKGGSSGSAGKGGKGGSGSGGTGGAGAAGGRGGAGAGSGGDAGAGSGGEAGAAPSLTWTNATANLAGMESECGNLTLMSTSPDTGTVIAGVAKVGLLANDGGGMWLPLGTGAGSATIVNRPSAIVYDPEHPGTFWESGIYNGGGIYKTTDDGETFEQVGTVNHNDLVSIDFTDPSRQTLLAGTHEQKRILFLSTDGGENFDDIGMNLPADSHFSSAPHVVDAETFLLGACGYGDGTCGVYRSTDTGATWDLASDLPVSGRPLVTTDGTIYWSLIYDGGMARSDDQGETWQKTADNLLTIYPVELPDGRILSVRGTHVVLSSDQGVSWSELGEEIPFKPAGITYSPQQKLLFAWHWDCGPVVLDDAIASAEFDYR